MKYQAFLKFGSLILLIVAGIFLVRFLLPEGFGIDDMRQFVATQGIWAPIIFMGAYILAVITFLPASPLSLLGGALFGPIFGTIYIVIAATIGASLAFLMARFLGRDAVSFLVTSYTKKIATYDEKLEQKGFLTVLILRLIPAFPFNALNFVLGLTKVKVSEYFFATLIGIIPGSFVFAYAGATAAEPSLMKILIAVGIFAILLSAKPLYQLIKRSL